MTQLQADENVPSTMDNITNSILTLQQENISLKKQVKTLEAEKENLRAFLEQKIEILEAQVSGSKEREENMKRVNQTIMQTLEEMNEKGPKNGLNVKAIEELEKATQQYNQALLDLKTRMKEETGKLEMEVKQLTESAIEKDYELKALKSFLKEMRMDYNSNRSPVETRIKSVALAKEEAETVTVKSRVQTMPEQETWTRTGLDGRRDTMRCHTIEKEEGVEYARSNSMVFDQNSVCYKDEESEISLKGASHRHKIEYYWKDLAKRKSRVENKEKLEELYLQHQLPMSQLNSPTHQLLRQETQKVLTTSTGESSNASISGPRLQKGTIISASTISLSSDINRQVFSEQSSLPWENSGPIVQGRPIFTEKKEIGLRDQLWNAAFLDFKRKSIEQAFCPPRNTEGFRGIHDLSVSGNYEAYDQDGLKNGQKNKMRKPNKYKRQSQTCFENIEDVLQESKASNCEVELRRENVEQYMKGDEAMLQRRNSKEEEENVDAKSEIKFMIGRLLKVKNKLEKQSNVLNVSRTTHGWEQPPQSHFQQCSVIKEEIGENEKSYRLAKTERKPLVLVGTKSAVKGSLNGKKETIQPRKIVR